MYFIHSLCKIIHRIFYIKYFPPKKFPHVHRGFSPQSKIPFHTCYSFRERVVTRRWYFLQGWRQHNVVWFSDKWSVSSSWFLYFSIAKSDQERLLRDAFGSKAFNSYFLWAAKSEFLKVFLGFGFENRNILRGERDSY